MRYTSPVDEPRHCSLRFTRRYAAPPAAVWRALTEPASIERWLGFPVELEVRVREPERLLELDWRRPGEEPSVVRFELREEGGGTVLVLDHSRIDERQGMASLASWVRAIARFERVVEQ
jgi:uncharacterized protein YndB with AHSA1/START domain